ncbi:ornithine cyclodeaminase [Amycolatopsis xylanica]|uniref:Ornithine cyclodeaminase n=1 Tax=Amycolatopsis xylanica TaxID=589385 RepID=A0A1H3S9X2_9PSEU|nr:ornithine cyclodeaminase family protein [Amycolatopsis xylanica]SDZ33929.1 ornithine cyclodeaminase [Amycolatopsis xylanica]
MTRVFRASSIRRAVGLTDLIEPVARAFADFSRGLGEAPMTVFAPAGPHGDVHVKCAWLPDHPMFTVKVAASFAARAAGGEQASSGYVAIHDATTGDLLALLRDEHYLTDVRTAAAGAVATRMLARPDARTVAVLGTGVQAHLQVLAVRAVRAIDRVLIWGRRRDAAGLLRETIVGTAPELSVSVADSAELAVREADIVVTATGSRQPILHGSWLRPGQHVTAVGADDPGKAELDPACFQRADLLVVDSLLDTPRFAGDLRRAIEAGAITPSDVDAEVGDLVLGRHPGRRDAAEISVAKLVGLGVQDLVAAETAMRGLAATPRPKESAG